MNVSSRGRWSISWILPLKADRWLYRTSMYPKLAATSASAVVNSALIHQTRVRRQYSTRRLPSSPGSMPASARSIFVIRMPQKRSDTSSRPLPRRPTRRCIKIEGKDRCKTAIQSNNLETDDRGYVYVVDRANTGLHILELTEDAKRVTGQQ